MIDTNHRVADTRKPGGRAAWQTPAVRQIVANEAQLFTRQTNDGIEVSS